MAAVTLLQPALMLAAERPSTSWENLRQLAAGQEIEITKTDRRSLTGRFISFTDESIRVHGKRQDVTISRTDVSRVRLRPTGRRKYTWIGAGIGAGAGAGIGAAMGESLGNQSGGDFRNLKPAIIGVSAGIGALAGAAIGSVIGGRHTTIYVAK